MSDRAAQIASFLVQAGWDEAEIFPFGADFSSRRYARLVRDDARAILMDADPNQKTDEFILIGQYLREIGLSAPEIYAGDPDNGLVLEDDFGGRNIGGLFDAGEETLPYYRRAVDVLVHLHKNFDRAAVRELDVPIFGGALFAAQAELFLDYYLPHVLGREATHDEGESFRAAWKVALKGIDALPQVLMLRDFMPDNLMDLPGRAGVKGIGLLDFQDGGLGPVAYDLTSLCECVRRDSDAKLLDDMIAYYHGRAQPALSLEDLRRACRILSAQRHMRILGIVAKLAQQGRPEKRAYIPRIRAYLGELLQDEALAPVAAWAAPILGYNKI